MIGSTASATAKMINILNTRLKFSRTTFKVKIAFAF